MPGTNDFQPFAMSGGANVISQADYLTMTSLLANGFSAGEAYSNILNKVWRQSSIMAAVLGDLIIAQTGQNVIDDGTTATILANLIEAIQLVAGAAAGLTTVASSTTPDIWTGTSSVINYTGAALCTGFSTGPGPGATRRLLLSGAASFRTGATLQAAGIPLGMTFTLAAGDEVVVTEGLSTFYLSGSWLNVGHNQSWQNVAGSRLLNSAYNTGGNTYENGTPRPIVISTSVNSASTTISLYVGSVVVSQSSTNTNSTTMVTGLVLPGAIYQVVGSGTIENWAELL